MKEIDAKELILKEKSHVNDSEQILELTMLSGFDMSSRRQRSLADNVPRV